MTTAFAILAAGIGAMLRMPFWGNAIVIYMLAQIVIIGLVFIRKFRKSKRLLGNWYDEID